VRIGLNRSLPGFARASRPELFRRAPSEMEVVAFDIPYRVGARRFCAPRHAYESHSLRTMARRGATPSRSSRSQHCDSYALTWGRRNACAPPRYGMSNVDYLHFRGADGTVRREAQQTRKGRSGPIRSRSDPDDRRPL